MIPGLSVFRDHSALADAASRFIVRTLAAGIAQRGTVSLVLSGGQTPRAVYQRLRHVALESGLDWGGVDLFWGDERSVPPDHPESNFRMAREALIQHIAIPEANVHRIMSEYPPAEAAARYEAEIREHFGLAGGQIPVFDTVLLGTGDDGHIASIFPGSSAETEKDELVSATFVEKLQTHRITLTLPVLKNANELCLLVTGAAKAKVLRDVSAGESFQLPVHQILTARGKIHWFADHDAASLLHERKTE